MGRLFLPLLIVRLHVFLRLFTPLPVIRISSPRLHPAPSFDVPIVSTSRPFLPIRSIA